MTVVSGIGLARRPGRRSMNGDIRRFVMKQCARVLLQNYVPIPARHTLLHRCMLLLSNVGGGLGKGDTFENDFLKLTFNATAIANIADNAASAPLTNLFVSLHTADPGEAGIQTTSEISYTGYARVAVIRTGAGWVVTTNSAVASAVNFAVSTGGTGGTVTHFAVGTVTTGGAGKVLYAGTVTPNIVVANTIQPTLPTVTCTED